MYNATEKQEEVYWSLIEKGYSPLHNDCFLVGIGDKTAEDVFMVNRKGNLHKVNIIKKSIKFEDFKEKFGIE